MNFLKILFDESDKMIFGISSEQIQQETQIHLTKSNSVGF